VVAVPVPVRVAVPVPVTALVPVPVTALVPVPVTALVPVPVTALVPVPVTALVPVPVTALVPVPVTALVPVCAVVVVVVPVVVMVTDPVPCVLWGKSGEASAERVTASPLLASGGAVTPPQPTPSATAAAQPNHRRGADAKEVSRNVFMSYLHGPGNLPRASQSKRTDALPFPSAAAGGILRKLTRAAAAHRAELPHVSDLIGEMRQ